MCVVPRKPIQVVGDIIWQVAVHARCGYVRHFIRLKMSRHNLTRDSCCLRARRLLRPREMCVAVDVAMSSLLRRSLTAADGRPTAGLHGLGAVEAVSLSVPAAVALALMLAAGSFINAQHTAQEDLLLQHRLLLREWAPEVEAPAGGASGGPPRRQWAVDQSADDMLRIAAKARCRSVPPTCAVVGRAPADLLCGLEK